MKERYFLIGFVAISPERYHTFETFGTSYPGLPSLDECRKMAEKNYNNDLDIEVKILSLSEFSKDDFEKMFDVE